uniref:Uncharacterized protein n=1 Tax=Amphimedon queenslandica TaxID=400682 RepID=A0A1X7US90_AMPQE
MSYNSSFITTDSPHYSIKRSYELSAGNRIHYLFEIRRIIIKKVTNFKTYKSACTKFLSFHDIAVPVTLISFVKRNCEGVCFLPSKDSDITSKSSGSECSHF